MSEAVRPGEAHMGPIPLRGNAGTLTAEDRNRIWHATGVSASVRWRQQWGARCLTLNGPAEKLTEAKRMADEAIRANGTEGGRAPDPQETLQRVNQVASSQNSMWTSMQAMSGRIAVLEAQVMEAQNAAAAASAAAYEAAVQAQALQQQLQAKKKRKKRAPKSSNNSLVIVRANEKSAEARRCRSCHNVRSAIQRLAKRHGNLVKEFSSVTGDRVQEFFSNCSSLRGEDLRMKIEETVTDWKTATTTYKFTQDADYVDEVDLRKRYQDRPELAENVLLNGRRFFCPVKKVTMYADPKYNAKIEDQEEHGTSTKRKAQTALKEDEDPKQESKINKRKKGNGKGKAIEDASGSAPDPKLTAGQKKKLGKKLEAAIAKATLLQSAIEKAKGFGEMIPAYVLQAAQNCLPADPFTSVQESLNAGKGVFEELQKHVDDAMEKIVEATARVKTQVDSAEAFQK
eukprot:Skav228701  [mRNA]  locus=scaffold3376:4682:10159:+ [translate_table: standard]